MATIRKTANKEYSTFVLNSRHNKLKSIFDTYINYDIFKETLNEYNNNVNNINNKINSYYKIFVTEKDKENFLNGIEYDKIKKNIEKIILKANNNNNDNNNNNEIIPLQEIYNFKIYSLPFKDISNQKQPKINFIDNIQIFNININKNYQKNLKKFNFRTKEGKNYKFLNFNSSFINRNNNNNYINNYIDNLNINNNYQNIINTLLPYSIQNYSQNSKENFTNKITISEINKEIFTFNPILISKNGKLLNNIYEENLKKRGLLLKPYRFDFNKKILLNILRFIFKLKYKLSKKKKFQNQTFYNIKKVNNNNRNKLKEIEGSNIITFNNCENFINSKFGNFNIKLFEKKFKENLELIEENKKKKRVENLQKKIKKILSLNDDNNNDDNINDEDDFIDSFNKFEYDKDNDYNSNINNSEKKENFFSKNKKKNYNPKKKLNYLNGLKMLIEEETNKKNNN